MTKNERIQLYGMGLLVLRPKHDAARGVWRIEKSTYSGGWELFGGSQGYPTKSLAEEAVEKLCNSMQNNYTKDQ